MKTSETLLASFVVSAVAGGVTALLVGSMRGGEPRAERTAPVETPAAGAIDASADDAAIARRLDDLRIENAALAERLRQLEARLAEGAARQPVEEPSAAPEGGMLVARDETGAVKGDAVVVTPAFVESVNQALSEIRAREEVEELARRKELQAARIEQRVTELQEKLGLSRGQVADVRTALLTQDEKREALFTSLRDTDADRRTVYESMRSIRDETNVALERSLTPEQFQMYRESEEAEFRRFGGGPPGGVPPGFDRGGREGR